jgi:hypothetical protein
MLKRAAVQERFLIFQPNLEFIYHCNYELTKLNLTIGNGCKEIVSGLSIKYETKALEANN